MPRTLWLARHANRQDFVDPDWHATADRPHDPGLSSDGEVQAQQLASHVAALGIDRILTSPFLRTVQTAHRVGEATDRAVHLEPGLGEWLNTNWFDVPPETLPGSTLRRRFPTVDLSHTACVHPTYPESKTETFERIGAAVRCLATRYAAETLLLVGHGITVQGALLGLVGDVRDEGVPLASLTQVVERDGTWTIQHRNVTDHLDDGAQASGRLA